MCAIHHGPGHDRAVGARWCRVLLLVCALDGAVVIPALAAGVRHDAPLPYSCATIRWAVSNFTPEHLEALAKKMGVNLTVAQRRAVDTCIHGGGP